MINRENIKTDIKIEYTGIYIRSYDITIIMKYIYDGEDLKEQYVSGFYYGIPTIEDIDTFKEKNYLKLD